MNFNYDDPWFRELMEEATEIWLPTASELTRKGTPEEIASTPIRIDPAKFSKAHEEFDQYLTQTTTGFEAYQQKPVEFGYDFFGETYTDDVQDLMISVRDNRATIARSANATGNRRFAFDAYRRLINMFGDVVMGVDHEHFEKEFTRLKATYGAHDDTDVPTEGIVQLIDGLLIQDRRVTVKALAAEVGVSVGSVHTIMMERLNMRKVCTQWVPHSLQPQQEASQMAHCLDHLQRYAREGNAFLARVVTGDESWCHHFEPESKRLQ